MFDSSKATISSSLIIEGGNSLTLSKGEGIFTPSKIFALPNSKAIFMVSTPAITRFYKEFFDKTSLEMSNFNENGQYFYIFSLEFRECRIGEVFISQINRFFNQLF